MSIVGAIVAGLGGAIIMSVALAMTPQMGASRFDLVGLLATGISSKGMRAVGFVMHLVFGVLWACLYAALWSAGYGSPSVTNGALFGAAHWLIAGLLLGLAPYVHAGIRAGTMKDPGVYLRNLGGSTGFITGLAAHVIYGMTVGLIYGFFRP